LKLFLKMEANAQGRGARCKRALEAAAALGDGASEWELVDEGALFSDDEALSSRDSGTTTLPRHAKEGWKTPGRGGAEYLARYQAAAATAHGSGQHESVGRCGAGAGGSAQEAAHAGEAVAPLGCGASVKAAAPTGQLERRTRMVLRCLLRCHAAPLLRCTLAVTTLLLAVLVLPDRSRASVAAPGAQPSHEVASESSCPESPSAPPSPPPPVPSSRMQQYILALGASA
jgi:hypothetical protein